MIYFKKEVGDCEKYTQKKEANFIFSGFVLLLICHIWMSILHKNEEKTHLCCNLFLVKANIASLTGLVLLQFSWLVQLSNKYIYLTTKIIHQFSNPFNMALTLNLYILKVTDAIFPELH